MAASTLESLGSSAPNGLGEPLLPGVRMVGSGINEGAEDDLGVPVNASE